MDQGAKISVQGGVQCGGEFAGPVLVRRTLIEAQKPEHRVEAVHSVVKDDVVAAKLASEVLHPPEVAARVAADGRGWLSLIRGQSATITMLAAVPANLGGPRAAQPSV